MYADQYSVLLHTYYGKRIDGENLADLIFQVDVGFSGNPEETVGNREYSLDCLPQELPSDGVGDYRESCISLLHENGSMAADFRFESYEVFPGSYKVAGMPALYDSDGEKGETLVITMREKASSVVVRLCYGVFEKENVITRAVRVENRGESRVVLDKCLSCCLDLQFGEYDLITFAGRHTMERGPERNRVRRTKLEVGSMRGTSSHQYNPTAILCAPDATEDYGDCYGLCLVYSGNFAVSAEVDMHQNTRFQIGINPFDFSWLLEPGQSFQSPEAVLVYSGEGLGRMSQIFHHMYQDLLIPERFAKQERPVLLNSWEAHYFDFDGTALTALAAEAAGVGAELFVLDDGWFGKRSDTTSSVGDWTPNEEKLGGSLQELIAAIEEKSLAFGLWFEPEMVSPDSHLYRRHPEWVIQAAGRRIEKSRDEYVLDLSNPAVCEHIITSVGNILSQNHVRYVKWDMNRNLTNLGSTYLPAERQQEQAHRYILGLYHVLDTLTQQFPDVLFEGCAGGGGRFDPGILYYMPQMWPSDDTDAMERLAIQYGVSLLYPPSAMECHISESPNHQVARREPLETRSAVAMWGNLGLELNLVRMDRAEKAALAEEIAFYKKVRPLVQFGDLYRLKGLDGGNQYAWMFQSQDQKTVFVSFVQIQASPNTVSKRLRLRHLDPDAWYRIEGSGAVRSGRELMHIGLDTGKIRTDAYSRRWLLTRVDRASC